MGAVIGDILPLAIGVAISPIPIIAIILMLGTPRARSNGPAFVAGWLIGLAVVGTLVLLLASGASQTDSGPSTAVSVIQLLLGVLFLLLAARQCRSRPKPGEQHPMPQWMQSIDRFAPGKAFGLAILLSSVNPKNLVLTLSAAGSIAKGGLGGGQQAVALMIFALLATVGVALPLAVFFAGGKKAAAVLEEWKQWMGANNATIMFVLFLVLGLKVLGSGIGGLTS